MDKYHENPKAKPTIYSEAIKVHDKVNKSKQSNASARHGT